MIVCQLWGDPVFTLHGQALCKWKCLHWVLGMFATSCYLCGFGPPIMVGPLASIVACHVSPNGYLVMLWGTTASAVLFPSIKGDENVLFSVCLSFLFPFPSFLIFYFDFFILIFSKLRKYTYIIKIFFFPESFEIKLQIRCCFTTIYLLYCVFFILNTFAKVKTHESQGCSLKTRQPESSGVGSSGSLGDSLVIQWLWLCPSTAGGMGLIPGQGTKILHAVLLLLLLLSCFSRVLLCATPIDGSPPGSPVPGIQSGWHGQKKKKKVCTAIFKMDKQ